MRAVNQRSKSALLKLLPITQQHTPEHKSVYVLPMISMKMKEM